MTVLRTPTDGKDVARVKPTPIVKSTFPAIEANVNTVVIDRTYSSVKINACVNRCGCVSDNRAD